MDGQYLLHALEGGARGLCIVACPKGECHLGQGNYRAEVRLRTIQRLLGEAGLEPQRAELLHCSPNDSPEQFDDLLAAPSSEFALWARVPFAPARPANVKPRPMVALGPHGRRLYR